MSAIVNTNLASLGAQGQLSKSRLVQSQAIQRLSSGLRINSASDDAAGVAIAARMSTQLRGLNVAARNAQDAISLSQTAEGSLSAINDNLQRMRELSVQASNATNSASDRTALQQEVTQLVDEIDRVARQVNFNGQNLLDGSFNAQHFQVGANAGQTIDVSGIANTRSSVLGAIPSSGPLSLTGTTLTSAAGITGAGQFIVNGVDVYQGVAIEGSAKGLADAINAANITGVSATAAATVVTGTLNNIAAGQFDVADVTLNGTTRTETVNGNFFTPDFWVNVVAGDLNTWTPVGVVNTGNGLQLTAADGSNINFSFSENVGSSAGAAAYGLGNIASTTFSHYTINSAAGLVISGSAAETVKGLANGPALTPGISQINVSSISNANSAIVTIDHALDSISSQRANLGALQNRLDAAIGNINTSSANTSAARSRITDADFAQETARLVSSNVLQQAAAAIVAQANALPSNVLALLRA